MRHHASMRGNLGKCNGIGGGGRYCPKRQRGGIGLERDQGEEGMGKWASWAISLNSFLRDGFQQLLSLLRAVVESVVMHSMVADLRNFCCLSTMHLGEMVFAEMASSRQMKQRKTGTSAGADRGEEVSEQKSGRNERGEGGLHGKQERRYRKKCEHGRLRSRCKACGGSGICEHGRQRYQCKACGGSGICEHNRQRSRCMHCGGSGICEHGRERS
eukprot:748037-Hanusia_phi.AAC.1